MSDFLPGIPSGLSAPSLASVGQLIQWSQRGHSEVVEALEAAGIRPRLILNGVEYFDQGVLPTITNATPKKGRRKP